MKKKSVVLIIDENQESRNKVIEVLEKNFQLSATHSSIEGLTLARKGSHEAIFLSASTPVLSGIDATSLLKQDSHTRHCPLLLITNQMDAELMANAKRLGVTDVLTRPLQTQVLETISSNLSQKISGSGVHEEMIYKDIKLMGGVRCVEHTGQRIKLTSTEYELLRLFLSHPNQILERAMIMRSIWKEEAERIKLRTIDVHLRALRKKIPTLVNNIQSIYGMGYRLEQDAPDTTPAKDQT